MSTITINPVALTANVEKNSAAHTLTANVNTINVQMTDSAGNITPLAGSNWLTIGGNVTQWGIQKSTDGGVTWSYFVFQTALPFGSLSRGGEMPSLQISGTALQGNVGDQLRLAATVDTGITLGAIITVD